MIAASQFPSKGVWFLAALVLLVALTGYTRLVAPWRLAVTNDEVKHLESWRNRYRTDDVYPLFLEKVEVQGWLEGEKLELLGRLYHRSSLVQRGLLILVDGHPPLFPVLAEVIEAATRSSLVAARMPSAIASTLAVFLMFRLGRRLRDDTLGLWLAALVAIGFLSQTYAGIARSYAVAQLATILTFLVFVREQQAPRASPWRLWLAAIFAQSTHWLTWPLVGPLVLIELVRRLRAGQGIRALVRQSWWYALLSVALLGLVVLHMSNTGIREMPASVSRELAIWCHFALASPFASLDHLLSIPPFALFSPAILGLLFLALLGLGCVLGDPEFRRPHSEAALALPTVRAGLLLLFAACVATPILLFTGPRFALIYVTGPTILAGIGASWVLRTALVSQIVLAVLLGAFSIQRLGWPQDPYERIFWNETDYEVVAAQVREALGPDDVWCAHPYFHGDCLYRYGPLPDPVRHLTHQQFEDFLRGLPRSDVSVVVFAKTDRIERHAVLRRASERWDYFNDYSVVRIPPRPLRGRARPPS